MQGSQPPLTNEQKLQEARSDLDLWRIPQSAAWERSAAAEIKLREKALPQNKQSNVAEPPSCSTFDIC